MTVAWQGVFPAVLTQFRDDQALDVPATVQHVETLVRQGVHGIIMLGTLGEKDALDHAEKLELLRAVVQQVAGRVPVLSGVAETSTRQACRLASDAQAAGVAGLMLLPALVYKADEREVLTHFRTVAKAVDLPIICYNNPVSYGIDITPRMFAELADEPKFVAIKESSDNVRRITDLRNLCGERYRLFCGVDDLILESVVLGADGWIAGLVNAFPAETMRLWQWAKAGDLAQALPLYRWFTPLLHLDTHLKLVQYIKLATQETGLGKEWVRGPRLPLVGAERDEVLAVIRRAVATRPRLA
jgi:4-hydroxy-tetrahydrodipicolinate synthase